MVFKRKLLFLLFLLPLLATHCLYGSINDTEYWQYFNYDNWKCGKCRLFSVGEMRFNHHLSTLYYGRLTEGTAYQALSWLDLEAHYSFIYYKDPGATHFINVSRLELEANPSLQFSNGVKLIWRNRLELLKKQAIPGIQSLFRQRLKAVFPISNHGSLVSFSCYDEVYYDLDTHQFTQNRLVPLALTFALSSRATLELFFMIRHFYSSSSDRWYRNVVFGSEVKF